MARKVFEVTEEEEEAAPLPFAVRYHFKDKTKPAEEEEFHAVGRQTAGLTLILGGISRLDASGKRTTDTPGVERFFEEALVEGEWPRFRALLHDRKRIVKIDTLIEILNWIVEEQGARPT